MSMKRTYTAKVTRVDRWWAIDVLGVKGAHTQARRLDQVASMATEVVSLLLEVPEDTIQVEVAVDLPEALRGRMDEIAERRRDLETARQAAGDAQASLARQLVAEGFTVRDVGELLGLSHQRISQLVNG